MSVTFFFDPCCPFTWRTSRWIRDVATRRGEKVHWRFLSLAIVNENKDDIPPHLRDAHLRALGALRVLAATDQRHGQEAVDRLYTALGNLVHEKDGRITPETVATAVTNAGLPAELAAVVHDTAMDDLVRESTNAAQARVGTETGSPVTAIGDRPGFFGPVLVPIPEGEDADRLFEAMRLLSSVPQFSELKRSRNPL